MNMILTVSTLLFPLITFPYVSRVLLVEANGKLAFAASVMNYFTMAASLGLPTYGVRVCAKVREDKDKLSKTVQELLIINVIVTAVTFAVFVASPAQSALPCNGRYTISPYRSESRKHTASCENHYT